MKLPRDIGGSELAGLLVNYGYVQDHQTGSHIRITSNIMNIEHHLTIPDHNPIKIGTLNGILNEVAGYLKKDKKELIKELFE